MVKKKIIAFKFPEGVHSLKEHHFEFASICLRSDGISQINTEEDRLFTLEESKPIHTMVTEFNEGNPIYIMHVPGKHTNADDDTRRFLSSKEGLKHRIAIAFVLQSMAQQIVASFFLKINKPEIPTKFFNHQTDAEEWLLSIKNSNTFKK